MSKYHVFINCTSFKRIIVEAGSVKEAEDKARNLFNCPDSGNEVNQNETRIATPDDYQWSEDES